MLTSSLPNALSGAVAPPRTDRNTGRPASALPATRSVVRARPLRTTPCPRCKTRHQGLCASHTLDRSAAKLLGCPTDIVDADLLTEMRQRALTWVTGLKTKVTARSRTGKPRDRGLAVAECGRPTPVMRRGHVYVAGKQCRDRACPRCAKRRARELGAELRQVVERRQEAGRHFWFVTLTIPKPHEYDPAVALDMARSFWRRHTNTKTKRGQVWRDQFSGMLRALEVTWSPAGKKRKDGSLVEYDGWHAHYHVLLEGGSKSSANAFVDAWVRMVGGYRSTSGKDCQPLDMRRVGQLTKYVWKPLHVDCPTGLCRKLFGTLHGRRMCEGLGSWKGWRHEVERQTATPILWGSMSAAALVRAASEKTMRWDHEVLFSARVGRERIEVAMTCGDAVRATKGWLTKDAIDKDDSVSVDGGSVRSGCVHGRRAGEGDGRPIHHREGLQVGPTLATGAVRGPPAG